MFFCTKFKQHILFWTRILCFNNGVKILKHGLGYFKLLYLYTRDIILLFFPRQAHKVFNVFLPDFLRTLKMYIFNMRVTYALPQVYIIPGVCTGHICAKSSFLMLFVSCCLSFLCVQLCGGTGFFKTEFANCYFHICNNIRRN